VEAAPLGGRTAVVTGANHGIGAAIAEELARLGANVLVNFLRPSSSGHQVSSRHQVSSGHWVGTERYDSDRARDASEVVALVERHGVRSFAVESDLAEPYAAEWLIGSAEKQLGPVSILVNNASGWRQDTFSGDTGDRFSRPTEEVSAATFDANFAVDAKAGALLIAEFARRHRINGGTWGRIVGLSSGGPSGFAEEVSYGAAKAALENYTMSAAAELAPYGVTANIVYPPITDTGWVTDEVRRFADSQGARVVEPAQVAEVVGWLCTDAAALVTGNRIRLR
jgi:3-oxoacyl-[acyl-carrier protein] reductase